jgi:geranyl-CoA carboxylase alpha subunit
MTYFSKVLIANRGEIAVRVIRGAKKQGYHTVAVYSEADKNALHVREADEAMCIGPAPAKDGYLVIEKIIAAAKATGAGAIHPGYGFLSEREAFAEAIHQAGLVFIGPDAHSIEAMGNKSASKIRMIAAGVPCVPGYQGDEQGDDFLVEAAIKVGLPVMIKAANGGGGRGMRLVHEAGLILENIQSARSEATNAFGSGQLLIEKAVINGRHVEIQIFGDRLGNVVYVGERDCSVQRRNQKVIEEAGSPAVSPELRQKMGEAAVAAAKAVQYVGAGTVEFMLGQDGAFYFLEMNTRLQVEHPVTELLYGVDLVEWQLKVAQGEAIPLTQEQINARRNGWAIEVRLCAEDPLQNYLPQTGLVARWDAPHAPHSGIRVDSYLESGCTISPFYDSMQAKVMAWGPDREAARTRLVKALHDTHLHGVISNRDYLLNILQHPAFVSGDFSTSFIGKYPEITDGLAPNSLDATLAAMALYLDDALKLADSHGLEAELLGWHSSHDSPTRFVLEHGGTKTVLGLSVHHNVFKTEEHTLHLHHSALGQFTYERDGIQHKAVYTRVGDTIWLTAEGHIRHFHDKTLAPAQTTAAGSDGRILAHTDGKILGVKVKVGDVVEKGQTLVVLEAMKMEFQLATPVAGEVLAVSVEAGQQVKARQLLVQVKPA